MIDRVKELATRLAAEALAHLTWLMLLAVLPVLFAAAAASRHFAQVDPWPVMIFMAGGWSLTVLSLIVWFKNHQQRRADRMLHLAELMVVTDSALAARLPADVLQAQPDLAVALVTDMLRRMCEVLAYRLHIHKKAAALLILEDNGLHAKFKLVAHFNHHHDAAQGIYGELTRDRGLAAEALANPRGTAALKDSDNPPKGSKWLPTEAPNRFRGHALVRLRSMRSGGVDDMGVLCFDVDVPWKLTKEDEQLMAVFADRIGQLWRLLAEPTMPQTVLAATILASKHNGGNATSSVVPSP